MAALINYYRIASDFDSGNTGHVGGGLCSYRTDTDCVAFVSNTGVADIDVVIACSEEGPGARAQRNIIAASCVASERKRTRG